MPTPTTKRRRKRRTRRRKNLPKLCRTQLLWRPNPNLQSITKQRSFLRLKLTIFLGVWEVGTIL